MYQKFEGERHTLREWRKLNNMSMQALADACGVHANSIMKWENDVTHITLSNLQKLAEALGISINDIIF